MTIKSSLLVLSWNLNMDEDRAYKTKRTNKDNIGMHHIGQEQFRGKHTGTNLVSF